MSTFCVIDCETTGMDDDSKVVEVAGVYLDDAGQFSRECQTFVNPQCPIPPQASAIHHITDEMVKGAPLYGECVDLFRDADYYVAHNSQFDRKYLGTFGKPWIDTYRCALRLWPDAPAHSNQVLSYWRGHERPPESAGHAHRALYDCYVTARLFCELSSHLSLEEMLRISEEPARLVRLNFGKHRGEKFCDVPESYLQWMSGQDFDEDIKFTVAQELKRRSP